jgi:hypothetical protein
MLDEIAEQMIQNIFWAKRQVLLSNYLPPLPADGLITEGVSIVMLAAGD